MTNTIQKAEITNKEFRAYYDAHLQGVQEELTKYPQTECPNLHDFAPGVYLRRILMPAGTFVIGKRHKTEHFNIVLSGSAKVMIDGVIRDVRGGDIFVSPANCKKVLFIQEDMVWATVHPTEETDLKTLEKQCVYSAKEEKALTENQLKELV